MSSSESRPPFPRGGRIIRHMADQSATVEPPVTIRMADGDVLDPLVGPQCSLAVQLRRATARSSGGARELDAIAQEMREASDRLAAVTLEGEPGIGKTRLLLAAAELASASGFTSVAITADEEIRGPFLVARSLFARPRSATRRRGRRPRPRSAASSMRSPGATSPASRPCRRTPSSCAPSTSRASRSSTLAGIRPLALLIDDVQWADDDTLRMLRYVVRSDADQPDLPVPDHPAGRVRDRSREAVNFVADMERMGLVRRLRPGPVQLGRDGGAPQARPRRPGRARVGGRHAGPVRGRAVHRRGAGADAPRGRHAPAGRRRVAARPERGPAGPVRGPDAHPAPRRAPPGPDTGRARRRGDPRAQLQPARPAGDPGPDRSRAIAPQSASGRRPPRMPTSSPTISAPPSRRASCSSRRQGEPADYTFTHEQVRDFAAAQLSAARRRQVHAAVVDLLLEGGDPAPAGLPMLAQHALAAGDTERAAQFSIDAATAALASNAPEEALRLVEQALPVVSSPADRRVLLATRDDAFAVLRQTAERLDGLAELAALAEAMRDPAIEFDVQLRRASALRMSHDEDAAAELARRVARPRRRPRRRGHRAPRDPRARPGAPSEHRSASRSARVAIEVDLDGAESAYRRAIELAEQLGDDRSLAAALREIGMIEFARARAGSRTRSWPAAGCRARGGRRPGATSRTSSWRPPIGAARSTRSTDVLERALAIYERLGDRTGVMSTVIAMAYAQLRPGDAPVVVGAAPRGDPAGDEPPVRARHRERARPPGAPDAVRGPRLLAGQGGAGPGALPRRGGPSGGQAPGRPDHRVPRRRRRGDEPARARRRRRGRALARPGGRGGLHGTVATARSVQLETWRGMVRAGAGDADGMRRHLEQAVAMATEAGRASARCEALARLALEAARLVAARRAGTRHVDPELVELVERSAAQVKELLPLLPGHAPWGAQADAALATIALARGDIGGRGRARRRGPPGPPGRPPRGRQPGDRHPGGPGPVRRGPPEAQDFVRGYLQPTLSRIAQGTADETIRVRWLTGPVGRELVELAGPLDGARRGRRLPARRTVRRRSRPSLSLDDDRAPPAPAPDRGPDERRDRRRARPRRGRRGPAPRAAVRPARDLEPRRGDLARVPRARRGGVG